jgi:hypothetical protein
MDKTHMLDMPHVESQDVAADEGCSLLRQNAALQCENAALREDNADLRASALWWKALYEETQRRCADLESAPKSRVSPRVDARFAMPSSSAAHAPRAGAPTRSL